METVIGKDPNKKLTTPKPKSNWFERNVSMLEWGTTGMSPNKFYGKNEYSCENVSDKTAPSQYDLNQLKM